MMGHDLIGQPWLAGGLGRNVAMQPAVFPEPAAAAHRMLKGAEWPGVEPWPDYHRAVLGHDACGEPGGAVWHSIPSGSLTFRLSTHSPYPGPHECHVVVRRRMWAC